LPVWSVESTSTSTSTPSVESLGDAAAVALARWRGSVEQPSRWGVWNPHPHPHPLPAWNRSATPKSAGSLGDAGVWTSPLGGECVIHIHIHIHSQRGIARRRRRGRSRSVARECGTALSVGSVESTSTSTSTPSVESLG